MMLRLSLVIGLALGISPLHAQESSPVVVKQVTSATLTSSGQPIRLPQGNAQVVVSIYDIAVGAVLPEHMHPYPRYGYVLAGTLRVTNTDTGEDREYKSGDFILEAVGQWHKATTVGAEPVKLLVIDMMEPGKKNVLLKSESTSQKPQEESRQ
jgi:quercetin dioxygenase-like cupin family protein